MMPRFTEIVPHISFDWLDLPYDEKQVETRVSWLDYTVYRCFDLFNFKVGYGI